MDRDEVLTLVREHLAEELEVDIGRINEETRFKEDLDADSLDLYELVMELEDRYGSPSARSRRPGSRPSATPSASCSSTRRPERWRWTRSPRSRRSRP